MFNCTKKTTQPPNEAALDKCKSLSPSAGAAEAVLGGGGGGDMGRIGNKKPIVLSSQRYGKILTNANQTDKARIQKEAEEEQKYREYLKKGNDELVVHFKDNIKRTQDQKRVENKEASSKKMEQVQQAYNQAKENEEKVRREKTAKAQQLLEKLKPGPRELHSAALQSEVLRARNVQRNISEEFERAVKKQACETLKCEQMVALTFAQQDKKNEEERKQNTNNYKQELLQTINENAKNRADYKKQLIKEQQREREAMDAEIKAQIEKEKAIMEKKRAALRKNALEAMKMVEQRRLRERMTDELEDRLCCVYNVGKRQLDKLKDENTKAIAADREKVKEANVARVNTMRQQVQTEEAERIRRDISRMQLKFTAEEQEKIRKDKAAKQARIEAYLRELQQQKAVKLRAEEEARFDMAQRFKNTEVNCLFTEAEKQERLRKVAEVRAQLKEQTEERARVAREEREAFRQCTTDGYEKDDAYFFEYAHNLMEDAHKKQRPLFPFVKVVETYKKEHNLDCEERKTPKHMLSHLNIGLRQPGDSKADEVAAAAAAAAEKKKTETAAEKLKTSQSGVELPPKKEQEKSPKEIILENCLKITELATAAAGAGGDSKDKCTQQCPAPECFRHGTRKPEAGDCASISSSAKRRYSVIELKKLNQAVAPPSH